MVTFSFRHYFFLLNNYCVTCCLSIFCLSLFSQVDQGSLGLPNRKYLLKGINDSTVSAYYETMVDIALALGAQNKTRVREEMMDVINFETKLANVRCAFYLHLPGSMINVRDILLDRYRYRWKKEETSVDCIIK